MPTSLKVGRLFASGAHTLPFFLCFQVFLLPFQREPKLSPEQKLLKRVGQTFEYICYVLGYWVKKRVCVHVCACRAVFFFVSSEQTRGTSVSGENINKQNEK